MKMRKRKTAKGRKRRNCSSLVPVKNHSATAVEEPSPVHLLPCLDAASSRAQPPSFAADLFCPPSHTRSHHHHDAAAIE
jgi:hypothetical protein